MRVGVRQPAELLRMAATRAEQLGQHIDDLYVEAIERYIEVTKHASAGSLRSRHVMQRSSPRLTIEIPNELFQRAEKVAERLEKRRDVMYAEALARRLPGAATAENPFNQGLDLPQRGVTPAGPA